MNKINTQKGLSYRGRVNVQVFKGKRTLSSFKGHNAGTLKLFKYLTDCLAGTYNTNQSPWFLRAFRVTTDGTVDISTSGEITVTAIPCSGVSSFESEEGDKEVAIASFKFLVPFSNLIANGTIGAFRIYSRDDSEHYTEGTSSEENWLAEIILPAEDRITTSNSKNNILITWEMIIDNTEGDN